MKTHEDNYTTIITPRNNWWKIDWLELWKYRELYVVFAWREIKVRYKQTVMGVAWVVFQPAITTIIFTVFFGNLAKIPSGRLPYSLFVLSGLVLWNFFSSSLSYASNSLIENENLIKKVYFPKLLLPLSSILVSLVDFFISLVLLICYSFYLGIFPSINFFITLPVSLFVTGTTSAGLGLLASSLNVRFRDVRYILPFFIQILLFMSPVIYPTTIVSKTKQVILALNPLTGAIESLRSSIADEQLQWEVLGASTVSAIIILMLGVSYFKSTEKYIADIV